MHVRIPHRTPSDESGFVLVAVVVFTLLLGGLSASFLTENMAEKTAVDQRERGLTALQVCEHGLVKATLEIFALKDAGTDGIGTVSGEFNGAEFEVTATPHATLSDRWILNATGTYKTSTRRLEVGLRRREKSDYVEGLFAKDAVTFNGTTQTDAFDSRLGTYQSQAVNNDAGGAYAEGGGHVGSNAGITLNGSSVAVRGNAIPGPGQTVSISGDPTIWGDVMPRRVMIDLPPSDRAEFEAALATNDNDQLVANANASGNNNGNGNNGGGGGAYNPNTHALSANGQEIVTLSGGTYFFTSVNFTGQSKLVVDGPTVIYVTGDFDVSGGGFVNSSGKPADLMVYAHPYAMAGSNPQGSHVKIRGGSQASMALYAPGAKVTAHGNDDLYGAFIGNTVTVAGNSRFHYDKALGEIQKHGVVTLERLYWRDLDDEFRRQ